MAEEKLTIENNTCIVSSSLLDELDYVIGGYGEPTVEFIFNFNAFVEAYILSSNFIITERELEHMNITRNVLFPNGRPVLDLLLSQNNLFLVGGFGNQIMQCVYVEKVESRDNETILRVVNEFCKREYNRIKKSLIHSNFETPIDSIKTYSLGFTGKEREEFGGVGQILIGETTNKPFEIVKSFFNSITNYNVQAALPIFTYREQIEQLNKKAISKNIYQTLCDIQGQNVSEVENYLGCELQAIPPLVSIVLSEAKNRTDITKILLDIRNDFTQFRQCCENFEADLNDAFTLKQQVEAIKSYKDFWKKLVKKYNTSGTRIIYRYLDLAKDGDLPNALDKAIDNQTDDQILNDLNWGKAAGKVGTLGWKKFREKRILNKFKGVVNLWSLIENTPTLDKQIKDFERVFNTKIDRAKISSAKKHLENLNMNIHN